MIRVYHSYLFTLWVYTQMASNFPLSSTTLQSALRVRKYIWDLHLVVELLCYKVYLYLILPNVPDCSPQLLQLPTLPSARTGAPKSPYLCQHLALSSFLDFLAEHSGCYYQHSCWNNFLSLLPLVLSFPVSPQLSSLPSHFLLTTSASCLHCWAVCFSNLKVLSIWTSYLEDRNPTS